MAHDQQWCLTLHICSHLFTLELEGATGSSSTALHGNAMAQPREEHSRVQISVIFLLLLPLLMTRGPAAHLLQHFHVDAYRCDINDLIFLMMREGILCRPLNPLNNIGLAGMNRWSQIRVCTGALVNENCFVTWQASQEVGNTCTLGEVDSQSLPSTCAWSCISLVALVQVLNRVHRTVRRQTMQIQQLAVQINQIQAQLDRT